MRVFTWLVITLQDNSETGCLAVKPYFVHMRLTVGR